MVRFVVLLFFITAVDKQKLLENDTEKIEIPAQGELILCKADKNQEPCEGMLFESDEAARTFYDDYAGRVGFITRVLSSRKSERDGSIISRGLGCRGDLENHKNGSVKIKKNKGREGCAAMILVKRDKPGNWVVRKFLREHNHPLHVSSSKRRTVFVSLHRVVHMNLVSCNNLLFACPKIKCFMFLKGNFTPSLSICPIVRRYI